MRHHAERCDAMRRELDLLHSAMRRGVDSALLRSALRVINRHSLVDEFITEVIAFPGRAATAGDFGIEDQP